VRSPRKVERCRECAADLAKKVQRNIVHITWKTPLPAEKQHALLLGCYCSSDCVLDAYVRGKALYHD
jgi:hypothetical protein